MTRAIEELEIDHRNMRQLLDIIEEEMDAYQQGRVPDFEILHLIVDYTLNYPEISHHPREDAICAMLVRRNPTGAAAVGNLMEEHQQLSRLIHRLAAALANVERDVETPKDWLDSLVREYLARSRSHMHGAGLPAPAPAHHGAACMKAGRPLRPNSDRIAGSRNQCRRRFRAAVRR